MTATIVVGGRALGLEFTEATFHSRGEFAGNLDFSVRFSEVVPTKAVLGNLRVQIPGRRRLIDIAGYREIPRGIQVTVYTELAPPGHVIVPGAVPTTAEVYWLEQSKERPIGSLRVRSLP